jgi:hypothetical protein
MLVGKKIKVRVMSVDQEKRNLILTKRKLFMKENIPTIIQRNKVEIGQQVYGLIVNSNQFGYIIKFFDGNFLMPVVNLGLLLEIMGILPLSELKKERKGSESSESNAGDSNEEESKEPNTVSLKIGAIISVFVSFHHIEHKKIGLCLTKQSLEANLAEIKKSSSQYSNLFKFVTSDVNTTILSSQKRTNIQIGNIYEFEIVFHDKIAELTRSPDWQFIIVKTSEGIEREMNFSAFVPKGHLADNTTLLNDLLKMYNDKSSAAHLKSFQFQYVISLF